MLRPALQRLLAALDRFSLQTLNAPLTHDLIVGNR